MKIKMWLAHGNQSQNNLVCFIERDSLSRRMVLESKIAKRKKNFSLAAAECRAPIRLRGRKKLMAGCERER